MIALPHNASTRIFIAVGLSLLLHAVAMFAPLIELPKSEVPLPPLTAKLEPLPAAAPKKSPAHKPALPAMPSQPATPIATEENASSETPVDDAPPSVVAPVATTQEPVHPAHPLPSHAQLTYIAHQGEGGLPLGQVVHRLDIENGQYTLKTVTQTVGLVSLVKSYLLTQTSTGRVDAHGLLPQSYREEKTVSGNSQSLDAAFDWEGHRLHFSHGGETVLPESAQDIVSFLYQLSQQPLDQRVVPMYISNGKKLERYELAVGDEEIVLSRLGKLRALPLRKIHGPGEEGLDIWLGLEYRLLPIKVRQIDRNGQVAGEVVVSEIRVSQD